MISLLSKSSVPVTFFIHIVGVVDIAEKLIGYLNTHLEHKFHTGLTFVLINEIAEVTKNSFQYSTIFVIKYRLENLKINKKHLYGLKDEFLLY